MSVFSKLAILFIAFLISASIPAITHAKPMADKDVLLFVAPQRVVIKSNQKSASALVVNKSDKLRRYNLKLIDQEMGEFGLTIRKKRTLYSVKRIVRFVPRRFTLKPGQRQTIRIMARRNKNMADGDYHSHLLFRQIPLTNKDKKELESEHNKAKENKLSFEIKMNYGLAIPVIVQVGKINSDINIGDAVIQIVQDERSGIMHPELKVSFLRSGNAEATGFLTINYVGKDGKPIELATPQWLRIYHEADKITKTYSLQNPPKGVDISKGKIVINLTKKHAGKEIKLTKEVALN